jgi:hypothetical protein
MYIFKKNKKIYLFYYSRRKVNFTLNIKSESAPAQENRGLRCFQPELASKMYSIDIFKKKNEPSSTE